jgi:hypothetical protein
MCQLFMARLYSVLSHICLLVRAPTQQILGSHHELSWLLIGSFQRQCLCCAEQLCDVVWVLVGDSARLQFVLVLLLYVPVRQIYLWRDWTVFVPSPLGWVYFGALQGLLETFTEEVVSGWYACPVFMGEQTSVHSGHQGSTDTTTNKHAFGHLGQARSWAPQGRT